MKRNDPAGGVAMLREAGASDSAGKSPKSPARCASRRTGCSHRAPRPRTAPAARFDRHRGRLRPRDLARRHRNLPGAPLVARPRRRRNAIARQLSQPRNHGRRAHRRPARGQRRDPALRLYRQPRSALAAGQHHGLHQRTRGTARRHLQADRSPCPHRVAGPPTPDNATDTAEPALEGPTSNCRRTSPRRSASSNRRSPRWTG